MRTTTEAALVDGGIKLIHLPVAPLCNVQCNFCNRRYDCLNEIRPGTASPVLKPQQAIGYLDEMLQKRPDVTALGIAGPGDPFANPEETMETLRLARAKYPNLLFCLATNGLDITPYIEELLKLKTSRVTITVNTFDPRIGSKIYAWVRDRKSKASLLGLRGAGLLIEHQREAIRELKERGVTVKINTIIIPGINDAHVPSLAKELSEMGVDSMTCLPMIPMEGTPFENLEEPNAAMLARVRSQAGEYIPQMASSTGYCEDVVANDEQEALLREYAQKGADKQATPCIAVATSDGLTVNQHLGEAARFLLFAPDSRSWVGFNLQDVRLAPEPGSGGERWKALAETLFDCGTILVSGSGVNPRDALAELGIKVVEMKDGPVMEGLKALFAGAPIPEVVKCETSACSSSGCGGGRRRRSGACFN